LGWGAFLEGTAQQFEILFQKLKLKMVSAYEFIRNLDDLLTQFMLLQLEHPKGDQSPKFNALVDRCGKQNILRTREGRKLFNKVHSLRTKGLHRLEREILCLFEGVYSGAADGYARALGKPAATLLHLGPGLGNALANFHNARKAGSPVVSFAGEHSLSHLQYDAPLSANMETFARTVSERCGRARNLTNLVKTSRLRLRMRFSRPARSRC
jgi:hypothetical protein